MSIWRRLKNLWYLSGLELREVAEENKAEPVIQLFSKKKMATIVEPAFLDQFDV